MIKRLCFSLVVILFAAVAAQVVFAEASKEEIEALTPFKYAMRSDRDINLAEFALIIGKSVYPETKVKEQLGKIDWMADEIKKILGKTNEPAKVIEAINRYLYKEQKMVSESMGKDELLERFMLPKVLDTMKGNCLGSSTLYWALAERFDLSMQAVVIPRHVFLQYADGNGISHFIEATSDGVNVPKEEYVKKTKSLIGEDIPKYSIGDEIKFRFISKQQFIGLILYNRGIYYLKRKQYDEGLSDFNWALILDPENHEAYKSRGAIYLEKKDASKALDDFQKALKLEPNCPSTYLNIGLSMAMLDRLDEAIRDFNEAIRLAPDYADAYHNRGAAYSKKELWDKALDNFKSALSFAPDNASVYYDRAVVYHQMGEIDKSIDDYTKSCELNPYYPEVYSNRGTLYARQEKWDKAITDYQKAIELVPLFPDPYRNLAIVYYKTKEYKLSLDNINKYLELISDDHADRKQISDMKDELVRLLNK
ncbi:MAG: tetratricopeptide repeat protein [Planctomycetes bacterium]|nr:tetratricopeptide repeat protein [Planctomycetota bacterium]